MQNTIKLYQNQNYSQNHGFGQFGAYIDMLSIKKHVLKLRSSMVASDMSFEPQKNRTIKQSNPENPKINQFGQFLVCSDKLGITKFVL